MNCWGFTPGLLDGLRLLFGEFLDRNPANPKAEFYLPTAVNVLIQEGRARVKVLPTPCHWFRRNLSRGPRCRDGEHPGSGPGWRVSGTPLALSQPSGRAHSHSNHAARPKIEQQGKDVSKGKRHRPGGNLRVELQRMQHRWDRQAKQARRAQRQQQAGADAAPRPARCPAADRQ